MHKNKITILFICPYPVGQSPSQRFRFEQYFQILTSHGYGYHIQSFLSLENWQVFYTSGNHLLKGFILLKGFFKRLLLLFKASTYNFVFIHREASPVGPPIFEWAIAKILRKKIIYDFDDAIWSTDKINEGLLEKTLRWRSKVAAICSWSHKVSCGNEYLAAFAREFNNQVVYNPTTIDTTNLHKAEKNKSYQQEKITIGWTGSHTTLKYLNIIESVLVDIERKFSNVEILIIANQKPQLPLKTLKFLPWKKDTEASDLLKIDIGIMPLPDDEWTKGKCGFKALQYMAMEIPAVVSRVGVNQSIVDHGVNGFQATTTEEWMEALELLIQDNTLRIKMGESGRKKVIDQYSVASNTLTFLSMFL
jgi:glycosyltransferase involved in cell wall biosynthesis